MTAYKDKPNDEKFHRQIRIITALGNPSLSQRMTHRIVRIADDEIQLQVWLTGMRQL